MDNTVMNEEIGGL